MKITWFGTASIKLESKEGTVLVDPFMRRYGRAEEKLISVLGQERTILITHGHVDHIADIQRLYRENEDVMIYGTKTPLEVLSRDGIQKKCLHEIHMGERLQIQGFDITVRQGKHVEFDKALKRKTLFSMRMIRHIKGLWWMLSNYWRYPENGEIVFYEIQAEGKRIQLMGSAGLDAREHYEKNADLLVLAYQGKTDIAEYALGIVKKLQPKKILLSHFDDAFPPISNDVDTKPFFELMKQKFPEVEVMIPQLDVSYTI